MDIVTKDWGKERIDLGSKFEQIAEMRPIEIHHKADITLDDKPGFCIVMGMPNSDKYAVIGQVSLAMLNDAMKSLGYQIVKL